MKTLFFELLNGDVYSKILLLVGIIFSLFFCFLIFLLTYNFFDTFDLSYKKTEAIILEKRFQPAHNSSSSTIVNTGKTTILVPITVNHPDKFFFLFKIENIHAELEVSKDFYENNKVKDVFLVNYAKNRFSNSIKFN